MGRPPCCDEVGVKKGPWTPEEDEKLVAYISKHGHGSWRTLPKNAGLNRCGKSCRLRWTNYLRPDIKRGKLTDEEERMIINLHSVLGNKWSKIAANLPGRTDNEIKNFWNTHIRKKLLQMGIDPETHKPRTDFRHLMNLTQLLGMPNLGNLMSNPWGNPLSLQADVTQLAKIQLLQNLLQIMSSNNPLVNMENNPNYLFGNQSLSTPIEAILNRTNTLQNTDSILNIGQEYANSDIFPQVQTQSDRLTQLDISKSWAGLESKSNPEVLGVNNTDRSTSHENNIEAEKALPALISVSPGTSSFNQMESCSNNNTGQILSNIESPSSSNIFDAWEKLLDDETSGSYWKEILDLTSTSASPISW